MQKYSLAAGQYFDVKIEYSNMTKEEFDGKIESYKATLKQLFAQGEELNKQIEESLGKLHYDEKN